MNAVQAVLPDKDRVGAILIRSIDLFGLYAFGVDANTHQKPSTIEADHNFFRHTASISVAPREQSRGATPELKAFCASQYSAQKAMLGSD